LSAGVRLSAALDAKIIVGDREAAFVCLWQEKHGEIEPEGLEGDLLVQPGTLTRASEPGLVRCLMPRTAGWRLAA
jgi:hypothetical protein